MSSKNSSIRWTDVFSNRRVLDAYRRFANGAPLKNIEQEFKNTEHAGPFRRLTRQYGAARARQLTSRAISRASR